MYKRFAYEDDDGRDIAGASRDACIVAARAQDEDDGGGNILLDDSRAVLVVPSDLMEDEIIRVSSDQLTREQACELLGRALWWDETTDTAQVLDRGALMAAAAARP